MARTPETNQELETPLEDTSVETPVEVEKPQAKLDPGHGNLPKYETAPEPEVEDVAPAPVVHKHSKRILSEAEDLGFPADFIDKTPSDDLDNAIYHMKRKMAREQVQANRDERNDRVRERAAPVKEPTFRDELGIEEGVFAPEMEAIIEKLWSKNQQLLKQVGGVAETVQTREARTTTDILDEAFSGLGAQYAPIFGDATSEDLADDSKEINRRNMVLQQSGIDIRKDNKATIIRKLKAATDLVYGDVVKPAAVEDEEESVYAAGLGRQPAQHPQPPQKKQPKPRVTEEDWNKAGLLRPSHRAVRDVPNGKSKANRTVEALLGTDDSDRNGEPFRV